jgi:vacuolar protein sorting-associated protein 29
MGDFGELVLVLGDIHIPNRRTAIPEEFKSLLLPGKMQHVLCTGNLCSKGMEDYLRTLANSVHITKGDMDTGYGLKELPETKVVKIGDFTIGLTHGHQVVPWGDPESLANLQRQLDVDILITGHTHKQSVYEFEGKYIVNPGSVTGAYSGNSSNITPSFVLMAIKNSKVVTFVYELKNGKVAVSSSQFSKGEAVTTTSA